MSASLYLKHADIGGLTGHGADRLRSGSERVVVIGAGGWLGLATLELLFRLLGPAAFAERVAAFGSTAKHLILRDGVSVDQRPLDELKSLASYPSLVLHLAFLTQEKAKQMSEVDYLATNRAISAQVLGALDMIGATGVFVPSSGAVYKLDDPTASTSMRLYGRLKLEDEAAFSTWAQSQGRRVVIARVFNLSGPYINKHSSYALASFIADALAGRPIKIQAIRRVFRSYVAISELMSVVFGLLTDGAPGIEMFDTAGERVLEMEDIARAVIEALNAGLMIDRPAVVDGAHDRYVGEGIAYQRLRVQCAVQRVDFFSQIEATAAYMSGQTNQGAPKNHWLRKGSTAV